VPHSCGRVSRIIPEVRNGVVPAAEAISRFYDTQPLGPLRRNPRQAGRGATNGIHTRGTDFGVPVCGDRVPLPDTGRGYLVQPLQPHRELPEWRIECSTGRMLHDIRYALRNLKQNPGFALVAILSLALGIGANAAIFSLADGVLLRPLPVPHPSEIMMVQSQLRGESIGGMLGSYSYMSYPDYKDLRDRNRSFAGLAAAELSPFGFATEKGAVPQMKFGALVSGNFFQVMDVRPALGRTFRPDEDQAPDRNAVVVLGYDLWKTEFAARPDVLGKTIFLMGTPVTVIGVAPENFGGPHVLIRCALFVPVAMTRTLGGQQAQKELEDRSFRGFFVHGRLKPGVSVAQAVAETRVIGQQLAQAYPATNKTCSLVAGTDLQSRLRQDAGDALLLGFLFTLAVVVLLIACANVMNLMLSRARGRAREIAVRLAVGAGRARLVRQLLTESLILALLGAGAGMFLAQTGVDLFSQIRVPSDLPLLIDLRLDSRCLLFALCACVASALLFGVVPALQSTNPDLVPALKAGRAEGGQRRRLFGRNALVIGQVAGSVLLLVFATQAYRGASRVLSSPLGFRTDHLLLASFNPVLARYTHNQIPDFYKQLLDRARQLHDVRDAALTEAVPFDPDRSGGSRVIPEGYRLPAGAEAVSTLSASVSDGYFATMGLALVQGRPFAVTDGADSPRVAIVNELFARKYYPHGAVGKRFRLLGPDSNAVEIVGVARQAKYVFPVEPPLEFVYLPLSQNPTPGMTLVLHTAGPSGNLAGPLREMVRKMDPGLPIVSLRTMEDFFDQRARGTLQELIRTIGALGLLGLVLALVGLYGLMTYSVGLRQREIGIRMAIGAGQNLVLKMFLRQGLTLAGIGIVIGLVVTLLAGKPATALIGTSYFYLPLLGLVAIALLAVAALGAYIPARRASLVDPNVVLRQE
jgi:predicted permease